MKSTPMLSLGLAGLLAVCVWPAAAQQDVDARANTQMLVVSGSGETKADPDVAYVTVGVVTEGKRAQEAAQANAALAQKVMDALRGQGIAEKDLQTSGFNVQPRYENAPNRAPTIAGYQVSNSVRATVRKLSSVGAVIDAALDAGANNVQGVSFALEAQRPAQARALADAMADAQSKAQALARAAGVEIGPPVRIEEASFRRPVPMMEMGGPMMARAATPISPGEMTVTANVTVGYRILAKGAGRGAALPVRSRLADERTSLSVRLTALRAQYSESHPAVRAAAARLAEIDRLLRESRK